MTASREERHVTDEGFLAQIPAETAHFVEPLLSEDKLYRFIGQQIDPIVSDNNFAAMYAEVRLPVGLFVHDKGTWNQESVSLHIFGCGGTLKQMFR